MGDFCSSSRWCQPRSGGEVHLHTETQTGAELVLNVCDDFAVRSTYMDSSVLKRKHANGRPHSTPSRTQDILRAEARKPHLDLWLNEQALSRVHKKADLETIEMQKECESILDTEKQLQREMGDILGSKTLCDARRRENLHKRWTAKIFEPSRQEIIKQIDTSGKYEELLRHKQDLYGQFLEHGNLKGRLFLDTFSPDEYYPFSLYANPCPPAETVGLKDPTLTQERKRNEEDRLVVQCVTGSKLTDRHLEALRLPPLPLLPFRYGTETPAWEPIPLGVSILEPQPPNNYTRMSRVSSEADEEAMSSNAPEQPPSSAFTLQSESPRPPSIAATQASNLLRSMSAYTASRPVTRRSRPTPSRNYHTTSPPPSTPSPIRLTHVPFPPRQKRSVSAQAVQVSS